MRSGLAPTLLEALTGRLGFRPLLLVVFLCIAPESSTRTPSLALAEMRHSSIDPTTSVYTDPKLLDVAGAVMALPALPLEPATLALTGTDQLST
jgi:hypothetical protein